MAARQDSSTSAGRDAAGVRLLTCKGIDSVHGAKSGDRRGRGQSSVVARDAPAVRTEAERTWGKTMALTEFQKTLTAYLRCLPFSDCRRFLGVLCAEARRFLAPLRAAVNAKTGALIAAPSALIAAPSALIAAPSMLLSEEGILAPAIRKKLSAAAF
jgi:hypothetical protein